MSEDGLGVEMVRLVLMLSDGEDERDFASKESSG